MSRRAKKKSALLITMGIMSMVIGALGLICGLVQGGSNFTIKAMAKTPSPVGNTLRDMAKFIERELPYWFEIEITKAAMMVLLAVLVMIAGIGLIAHKGWGRWLAVLYGFFMLILQITYAVYQFAFLMPVMEKWQRTQVGMVRPAGYDTGTAVGVFIGALLWSAFAIALAVSMLLPAAGTAVQPPSRRADREWDEEDDLENRPRRRRNDDFDDRPLQRRDDDRPRGRPDDDRYRARD
jgi:hypothetical protein